MLRKTYPITDMHCPNCAMLLESLEDELEGVYKIEASYRKGEMVVEYDEARLSEGEIIEAVKRKGYTVGGRDPGKRA